MRLDWSERALRQLEEVSEFAPVQARKVVKAVEWLASGPFPGMFPVLGEEAPPLHVWPGPRTHHVVTYRIEGDVLSVLSIIDGRRIR